MGVTVGVASLNVSRHPVTLCSFDERYLVVGHTPSFKPVPESPGPPEPLHRRYWSFIL